MLDLYGFFCTTLWHKVRQLDASILIRAFGFPLSFAIKQALVVPHLPGDLSVFLHSYKFYTFIIFVNLRDFYLILI